MMRKTNAPTYEEVIKEFVQIIKLSNKVRKKIAKELIKRGYGELVRKINQKYPSINIGELFYGSTT